MIFLFVCDFLCSVLLRKAQNCCFLTGIRRLWMLGTKPGFLLAKSLFQPTNYPLTANFLAIN